MKEEQNRYVCSKSLALFHLANQQKKNPYKEENEDDIEVRK